MIPKIRRVRAFRDVLTSQNTNTCFSQGAERDICIDFEPLHDDESQEELGPGREAAVAHFTLRSRSDKSSGSIEHTLSRLLF